LNAKGATEESFDSLEVANHVYTNVTVTTKNKAYIFILHSTGMTNIRVADLPVDVQHKLGYATAEEQAAAKSTSVWAKKTIARLEPAQVKGVEKQLAQVWQNKIFPSDLPLPPLTTSFFLILGSIVLFIHLFFSYCCMLICQKTGAKPSIIVFIP